MDKNLVIVCLLSAAAIAVYITFFHKSSTKVSEYYDPQAMGGRKFWGWGRSYAYPQSDMDFAPEICYQVERNYLCREGHTRKINPVTNGDQCCVNNFVYS